MSHVHMLEGNAEVEGRMLLGYVELKKSLSDEGMGEEEAVKACLEVAKQLLGRHYGVNPEGLGGVLLWGTMAERPHLHYLIHQLADMNASPLFLGELYQVLMGGKVRHKQGAHYTSLEDMERILKPSLVDPLEKALEEAGWGPEKLQALKDRVEELDILDPACGSGNFLMAGYLSLVDFADKLGKVMGTEVKVRASQFRGIDVDPIAVDLAAYGLDLVSRVVARSERPGKPEMRVADSLFEDWGTPDVIIGNPPYLGGDRITREYGKEYKKALTRLHPAAKGRADFCTYFMQKAHDSVAEGGYVGLIVTNSVRMGASREAGIQYIQETGGTLFDVVSSIPWSGEAAVHVSVLNWKKGYVPPEECKLEWEGEIRMGEINPMLNFEVDVSGAKVLYRNLVKEGRTPGHLGFRLTSEEVEDVPEGELGALIPHINGISTMSADNSFEWEFCIDLHHIEDVFELSQRYPYLYSRLSTGVLPDIRSGKSRVVSEETFWKTSGRSLGRLPRYISRPQVSSRNVWIALPEGTEANNKMEYSEDLVDDYSFGVLQSNVHWQWAVQTGSKLGSTVIYTPSTCFRTFPWPQNPSHLHVLEIAREAQNLRRIRQEVRRDNDWSFRELFRFMDDHPINPVTKAHEKLDAAVRRAYGFPDNDPTKDVARLLELNLALADLLDQGHPIEQPGIPEAFQRDYPHLIEDLLSDDVDIEAPEPL